MFILINVSFNINALIEECLYTFLDITYIWHQRYGHLSYKGLKTVVTKKMVHGLPQLKVSNVSCKRKISH